MRKIGLFVFFIVFSSTGFAQKSPFSQEQLNKFSLQAKDYIKDFTKVVKSLSNPKSSCDKLCRQNKIEGTVKHFKPGAIVQTVTLKNKTPRSRSVSIYLNSIVASYSTRFKLVILTFENIVLDTTSIKEVKNEKGQSEYHMKGSFTQRFCVKNENDSNETNDNDIESFTICEETIKEFEVIIGKIGSASAAERYYVLLGDITAKSIRSLKTEDDAEY